MMRYIGHDRDELLREAEDELIRAGAVEPGDLIVLTIGEPIGKPGGTNTLKIVRVGEHRPDLTNYHTNPRRLPCPSYPCANCSTTPPKTATACPPSTSTTWSRSRPSWKPPRKPTAR